MRNRLLKYTGILLAILTIQIHFVYAQNNAHYNLNTYNGLPSNHVYYSIVDRYGYLWIATDKGVVKYNGYTSVIHDLSTGLSNDDVWKLYEDVTGRIWLLTIANDLGYIYKDKYHKTYNSPVVTDYYPREVVSIQNGGILLFQYKTGKAQLGFVYNDTVHNLNIKKDTNTNIIGFISESNLTLIKQDSVYSYYPGMNTPTRRLVCTQFEDSTNTNLYNWFYSSFYNYVIYFKERSNVVYVMNIDNCEKKRLAFNNPGESIYTPYVYKDNFYITTNKRVNRYNRKMELQSSYSTDSLLTDDTLNNYVINILEDKLWGGCVGTGNGGLVIHQNMQALQTLNINLDRYKYVGTSFDKTPYWWNKSTHTLLCINETLSPVKMKLGGVNDITRIIPFDKTSDLLITREKIYWLRNGKNGGNVILKNAYVRDKGKTMATSISNYSTLFHSITSSFAVHSGMVYYATRSGGLCRDIKKDDTIIHEGLASERIMSVSYDSFNNCIWAYYQKQILVYNISQSKATWFDSKELEQFNIKKIDQIVTDRTYGNIFIKEHNSLVVYNPASNTYKEILTNYRLQNAIIAIYKHQLVVAGKFGIAICKIAHAMGVSPAIQYYNIKNTGYNDVNGLHFTGNNAIIETDKGLMTVRMPEDSVFNEIEKQSGTFYKFYATYNDSIYNVRNTDSINILQSKRSLYFDVINPTGNGSIRYNYNISEIESAPIEMNGNELYLPELKANRYYTMYITAYDDTWRSTPHKITLYIIPHWWQTTNGKRALLISISAIALLLVYSIVYITKHIVTRKHLKQNLKLELKNLNLALELKSIYAQINPHFIFNTLSTGLYFIKKKKVDEAYAHISSFSDLLRSYLKSSRSKYITIEEEVTNLTNYISLQQARFENKFDYHIIIDNAINAKTKCIPALLVQPLVENAISHGLLPNEDRKGTLTIEFKTGENIEDIVCIIDDDGIGRKQSKLYNEKSKVNTESYGTELIKELIDVFNKNENIHIDLAYIDKSDPYRGTTVIITIKQRNHE